MGRFAQGLDTLVGNTIWKLGKMNYINGMLIHHHAGWDCQTEMDENDHKSGEVGHTDGHN